MLLMIVAPAGSPWSETPKFTLGLEVDILTRAGVEFPCGVDLFFSPYMWYARARPQPRTCGDAVQDPT